MSLWYRFKAWIVFMLLRDGMVIEVEARHGAFRTRSRQFWKGGLIRVDIPVQRQHGHIDLNDDLLGGGRMSSEDAKRLIDAFTGVEGEHPLRELRPGNGKFEKIEDGKTVCAACGQELTRIP